MTFIKKDLNLIRSNVLTNLTYNIDEINDVNVGSALDMFVTSISYEIEQQYDEMQEIYNGFHIDTASDYDLDQLGKLIGVERNSGAEATGYITFIRDTAPSSVFTIPTGVTISTQPDTNSTFLSFTTTESKEFPLIGSSSETFVDGIYSYIVDNKVFADMEIEISATPFTNFTTDNSFSGNIIDTSTVDSLNTCEAITSWVALTGAAALTVNSTYKVQGSNSLNLIKTSTVTDTFGYLFPFTNIDLDGKSLCLSLRTTNSFLTNKFSKVEIILGSGYDGGSGTDNNNYTWTINDITQFEDGEFVRFFLDIGQAVVNNAPNITECDFIEIKLYVQNNTDTVSANEFIMDFWFACEYALYNGYSVTIDSTTKPTGGATMDFSYTPLSVDVLATANNVGEEYNVGVGKITYINSIISNISRAYNYEQFVNGTDIETDDEYRERITTGAYVQATSSSNAISANIKELDYVKDCIIIDMPEATVESEAQIYNDSTKEFTLDNFVATDTTTLLISDTLGGSADYVKDTDYELTIDNKINWDLGGTTPTDGNTVYVDYDYNKLGYFTVIVVGSTGYLTTTQLAEVTSLVNDVKSLGTIATISQATYTQINVSTNVQISTSYDSTIVSNNVVSAIEAYITALNIGDDVLLSQITKTITSVSGVLDTNTVEINSVASNYTITTSEKAVPNVVTLTLI